MLHTIPSSRHAAVLVPLVVCLGACAAPTGGERSGEQPVSVVEQAATASAVHFRDDFDVAGVPDPTKWATLDGGGSAIATVGGLLVLEGGNHKRVNTSQVFSPTGAGGIRASALINLQGDYQKFGFKVNPSEVPGGTGFYFDTFEPTYGGAPGTVHTLVWLGGTLVSDVAISASWGTFHEFDLAWTATDVSFLVDGQERSRVAVNGFVDPLPVGVWNDRATRMETDWVDVSDRKKIVILLQGINTSLSCDSSGNCTPGDENGVTEPQTFGSLRADLAAGGLKEGESVLWYSYKGGGLGSSGSWISNPYYCSDTAQRYEASITALKKMMHEIATNKENVDFYVVGHSQGGLIAFQSLGLALDLATSGGFPKNSRLKGVFTLDSPLGGVPQHATAISAKHTCWSGPANQEMDRLYESNLGTNTQQGDFAQPLCRQVGQCQGADTNLIMATKAALDLDVSVETYGSSLDAVYDPAVCFPPTARPAARLWFGNNLSSQVISTMPGGTQIEPDFYSTLGCDSLESSIVLDILSLPIDAATMSRLAKKAPAFYQCAVIDCVSFSHKWIRAQSHKPIVDAILQ